MGCMIGYTRVSTKGQADDGVSLAAQRRSIEAWAEAGGHTIVSWCSDTESGKDTSRPELQHALALVMEGSADGLVVTKVDRLSRSVIDFATIMADFTKADKSLVCIGDAIDMTTPSGRFVAGVLAGLAQLERELVGQRTREALAELKAQGVRLGRPPKEQPSAADVANILGLHADGHSQRWIANATGFMPSTVRRLVATS